LLLIGTLVIGGVACGGQSGTPTAVLPAAQPAADDGRVAALEQRLGTLETMVKGINDEFAPDGSWFKAVKQLQDDVTNLDGRLGTVETSDAAVSQLQQDVGRLKTSVEHLNLCRSYPDSMIC
jgi:hypothetical protein